MRQGLLVLLIAGVFSLPLQAGQIRVAVAANFKPVLQTLAERFEAQTGDSVSISSASTGVLYNQIVNGAPFDLFLSADSLRPEKLANDGLAVKGSRQVYAYGELVLWSHGAEKISLNDLMTYQGRLAIANPKTAPYGLAAQQVLNHLSLWSQYQGRIVQGASIQQTWQFVASGNVTLGMVAKAQLVGRRYEKANITTIPQNLYDPIRQEMVTLKRSRQPELTKKFRNFLMSETSQQYIASQGYRKAKD